MLGELDNEQIESLLRSETIGRIGCYADNKIYVVPVSYAYDGAHVYAHSKDGLKIRMMRKNPRVCFEVDHMENMANWQSVIASGIFEELTEPSDRMNGMKVLTDRFRPLMISETAQPSHGFSLNKQEVKGLAAVVFRLNLSEKTGRFERKQH